MIKMNARAHVLVSGYVHGVFFRSETRREARKQCLTGWVWNLPDGRVEALFEGEENAVKRLVEFCKRGPSGARVTKVEISWEHYEGEFNSFEIRY
jgi:acylphosphatase